MQSIRIRMKKHAPEDSLPSIEYIIHQKKQKYYYQTRIAFGLLCLQVLARIAINVIGGFNIPALIIEMALDPLVWAWGIWFSYSLVRAAYTIEPSVEVHAFDCPHCGYRLIDRDLNEPLGTISTCIECENNFIKRSDPLNGFGSKNIRQGARNSFQANE